MLTQAARGWGWGGGQRGGFALGHLAPGPALLPRAMDRDPHRLRTHKAPDRGPCTLPGPGVRVGGGGGICGRQAPTLRGEESCGEGSIARCSWGPSPAQAWPRDSCITGRSQEASGWAASLWPRSQAHFPRRGLGRPGEGGQKCSSAPPGWGALTPAPWVWERLPQQWSSLPLCSGSNPGIGPMAPPPSSWV